MRYLITLRFDGTAYHGWQVQSNAATVQQTVQSALERLLGTRPALTGCSRTDSGVHANMFCAHFDADTHILPDNLPAALNFYLPQDISVYACRAVPQDFHARYSARGKRYIYNIWNSPFRNPFCARYAYHVKPPLDADAMSAAAMSFVGRHDFAAFCSAGSSVESTLRTVYEAGVSRSGDTVVFTVCADGFLYNMVRIMAGTLIEVGLGKIAPERVGEIVSSAIRENAGPTAPPHGLCLDGVLYD